MARPRRDHERPIPAHPYRGTALVYGVMAVVVVIVATLTGGDVARALVVAVAFFVVATGWTWWRFRERIRRAAAQPAAQPPRPVPAGPTGPADAGRGATGTGPAGNGSLPVTRNGTGDTT